MISIEYDGREALDYLNHLSGKLDDLTLVMADIGEYEAEATKRRFNTSTGPDGKRWQPNTQTTILNYLGVYKGSYTKSGKLSAKGIGRVTSKKPLIGDTKSLSSQIYYNPDRNSVEIGSPMVYSAMQQFGGKKSAFPNLWGNIPARPFLGISDDDQREIIDIVKGYLQPA